MLMDNKAYLDQIAVKETKKNQTSLFSPALIKVIIGAIFLIIILIVIIGIFSGQNKASYDTYAELQQRYAKLIAEDSPMILEKEKLHSSQLRANTASFLSLAKSFTDIYSNAASNSGIDIYTLSGDRSSAIESEFTSFRDNLNTAYMNGYLDDSYASECAYQLAVLIELEEDIINTSTNDALKEVVYSNKTNLEKFQTVYENYGKEE